MATKSEIPLKLTMRQIIGLAAVLLVLVTVMILWLNADDVSDVPLVSAGVIDDLVERVGSLERQVDTDGEQDSLAEDARDAAAVEVGTLFSMCGDVRESIDLSPECRDALDDHFMTDDPYRFPPARNYLPPEDVVTIRRIHSKVAEKLEEVLLALGKEECNPPRDDIRLDLREECAADTFLEVGSIGGACGNYTAQAGARENSGLLRGARRTHGQLGGERCGLPHTESPDP